MKKQFLIIALLAASLYVKSQKKVDTPSSEYENKKLNHTELSLMSSYYVQDGNNAAVTGGIGTEELSVFSLQAGAKHFIKGSNIISYKLKGDVITSASVDNIDYAKSSPSYRDIHGQLDVGFSRKNEQLTYGIGTGVAMESDYLAFPVVLSASYETPSKMQTISATVNMSFDDLRWGRINKRAKTLQLVYPVELRGTEWFSIYRRNTYHLSTAFEQVLSKRVRIAVYPEFIYQEGLLSTTFHRVYFTDLSLKVENLPNERIKIPLGAQLNWFAGGSSVWKFLYRFYADDWDVIAHSMQIDYIKKINPLWSITAYGRVYTQQGSRYFKGYAMHDPRESFYTSDYDLAQIQTYKLGVGVNVNPLPKDTKIGIDAFSFRYAYYAKTNGFTSHSITLYADLRTSH